MSDGTQPLGTWLRFRNGRSSPPRTDDGPYPVWGSNGVIGRSVEKNVEGAAVVIGRVGSYCGSTYYSSSDCWVTDNAIVATAVDEREALYWYYVLLSLNLNQRSQGSGQPLLNQSILNAIPFSPQAAPDRLSIAATLGALDNKIESNQQLVYLIPDLIRARLTNALTTGMSEVPVADLATFVNGGAYTKGASGTGRIVVRIAELNSGPGGSTVYSDVAVPEDRTAHPGDILMSWSGSLGVYRWFRDEAIINQHIFKVIPADSFPAWLVFDRLHAVMPIFRGIAKDKATTMGHIQRGHLESTTVPVPPADVIGALDDELAALWSRLLLAERENMRLAQLRDTLLPELLSGRMRVPEPAQTVEVAA